MDSSDSSPSKKSGRGRGRGRGTGVRGRPRGSGRGRGKRAVKLILSDDEESDKEEPFSASDKSLDTENEKPSPVKEKPASPEISTRPPEFDLEADISQLEAPTFTTLNRGPPEPMLRLDWSLPVNLIGEKVLNPMIHCCDKCLNPILIYGRLIPCKHVYCLGCGRQEESKPCPRCKERVQRVEQTGLAQLFMCTHGGSRYGHDGCRRTYLSQRDLQAHVNHRHLRLPREPQKISTVSSLRGGIDRGGTISSNNLGSSSHHTNISVANNRSNLVSVPIQDSSPARSNYSPYVSHSPASSLVTSGGGYSAYAGQNNVGVPPHHNLQPYNQGYYNTPPSFPQPPPPPPPLPTYDNTSGYQWGGHNQSYYHR